MAEESTPAETATITTGWMNNFRWERELREESETSDDGDTTALSNSDFKNNLVEVQLSDIRGTAEKNPSCKEKLEMGAESEDSLQKATWRYRGTGPVWMCENI
ncbi:hypothetical protein H0H81_012514 [Sphagnurus paluster]|uniref:Uncharacterized protein n=1 Tax=Sphagnurus paluster TaxID=117069 RepID=A0A9P7FWM0_9AGAR|nr:hypothetical protein H0H81_012514 [Sphagnurus paluster]